MYRIGRGPDLFSISCLNPLKLSHRFCLVTFLYQYVGGGGGDEFWVTISLRGLMVVVKEKAWSARVPGHAFVAWCISWRMNVYIYYITAPESSISSQLGSSCQGNWSRRRYGPSVTYKITPAGSLSSSQTGRPPFWASPLAFGLIGCGCTSR
jgi:hypothetical protein